jgi:hypothetical protein
VHVLVAPADVQEELRVIRKLKQELAAQSPVVPVLRIARPASHIVEERIVVIALEREAAVDRIPDGSVHSALDARQVVLAEGGVDVSARLVRGLIRNEVCQAARGVSAEERALRATEHLDAVDVE